MLPRDNWPADSGDVKGEKLQFKDVENLGYVTQDGNKVEVNKKKKVAAEWWENIQGICVWKGGKSSFQS